MQKRWFRIRWADGEPARRSAAALLDRMVRVTDMSVIWIAVEDDLALVVEVDGPAEALLFEGLHRRLPRARLHLESPRNVAALTDDLGHAVVLCGPPPPEPPFPEALLALPTRAPASAVLNWRGAGCTAALFASERVLVAEALAEHWPGARVLPGWTKRFVRPFCGLDLEPSRMTALPSSEDFPMLASRKRVEREFACRHATGEILVGSDARGRPVRLRAPARLVWVGAAKGVGDPLNRVTRWWDGQVVVLDASGGGVDASWQGQVAATVVSWDDASISSHINPLMLLPGEAVEAHISRVGRWLRTLDIAPSLLGGMAWKGLLAVLRMMALDQACLAPPTLLGILENVEGVAKELAGLLPDLPAGDRAALDAVRWREDGRALMAAHTILSRALDVPGMALWFPPYLSEERMREEDWLVIDVPLFSPAQRLYWDSLLPLLEALYAGRADTLIVVLSGGAVAGRALDWQGPCSVVAWGPSVKGAAGKDTVPGDADLVVGAGADPARVATLLAAPPALLASQDVDQAEARIAGDVGSLHLDIPSPPGRNAGGAWRTPAGELLPAPLGVAREGAEDVLAELLGSTLEPQGPALIVGSRTVWSAIRRTSAGDGFVFLSEGSRPLVNPLVSADVSAWIWWGRGLGIDAAFVRRAHRRGIETVQGMLRYARRAGPRAAPCRATLGALEEACACGGLGACESDRLVWREDAPWLAVESSHAAVNRTLAMAALTAGARLVLVDAEGFVRSDMPMLRRVEALVCPAPAWIGRVLVAPRGRLAPAERYDGEGLGEDVVMLDRSRGGEERRIRWRPRS